VGSDTPPGIRRIVLVTGFESFNVGLYKRAAEALSRAAPGVQLSVYSDRDLGPKREEVEAALAAADVFFGSLLFDFDQVEWLRGAVAAVPVRLVFESALELMSSNQVGSFKVRGGYVGGGGALHSVYHSKPRARRTQRMREAPPPPFYPCYSLSSNCFA
jgi:hypothetical protein